MMTMLLASVRLWTGRTVDAVELAGKARRTFETIGDAYGLGQASAVLGRSLVMSGRVDEGFDVLLGALIEWHNSKRRAATATSLENGLVVLHTGTVVARCGDDNVSTASEKTFHDFDTNGTLAYSGQESVLALESGTGGGDLVQDIEVNAGKVATVLPSRADFALQVKQRNLFGRNSSDRGHFGACELGRRAPAANARGTWVRTLAKRPNDTLVE